MEIKELKWYEAPAVEIVEVESIVSLLADSGDELSYFFRGRIDLRPV